MNLFRRAAVIRFPTPGQSTGPASPLGLRTATGEAVLARCLQPSVVRSMSADARFRSIMRTNYYGFAAQDCRLGAVPGHNIFFRA